MLFAPSRALRVFAYPEPVDLRKGYDGLWGLVERGMSRRVLDGEIFVFVNRRRDTCKLLVWDGTGLCLFQKRLERGRFACLWSETDSVISLSASELSLFIEGCALVGKQSLSPREFLPTPLVSVCAK